MIERNPLKRTADQLSEDERFHVLSPNDQADVLKASQCSPWFLSWWAKQLCWHSALKGLKRDLPSADALQQAIDEAQPDTLEAMQKVLRLWRNQSMARFIFRDALALSHVRQTALEVSDLADCAVNAALNWSEHHASQTLGWPLRASSGQRQSLVVIAMGKHGAKELNLSSDIDLIFTYPEGGETEKGHANETYFNRVAKTLIRLLDVRTADGFVFRVDMRLRPWGESGALVTSFRALEIYFREHGRFWERFAMAKARPMTGALNDQTELMGIIRPFVFRQYVDYQAVNALRSLKANIRSEVRRQGLTRNIKLGAGGIREVEFIAQAFQLIRGGQDTDLQERGLWPLCEVIRQHQLLPSAVVDELVNAYDFLRDLEHRIQALRDEQTQMMPVDESDLIRLALAMGFESIELLERTLSRQRDIVSQHFVAVIEDEAKQAGRSDVANLEAYWADLGAAPSSPLTECIRQFSNQPQVLRLSESARANLDAFFPLLWQELINASDPCHAFKAIEPILEAVIRRTSYFALLAENPSAIRQLVLLAPASTWIAHQLTQKPYLLDELIDEDQLYELPSREALDDELNQLLIRVPQDDLERQMEIMRHFRHAKALRAAACEVTNTLPLMKISDYLAWVAETLVARSLSLAWQQMIDKHGHPTVADDQADAQFGVIAYGKMGGWELSYESDLDLVFIHNVPDGESDGKSQIDNGVYMARLGQKLIHLLGASTASGRLYEVDARLRPSGNSGLLVSKISAFERYQLEQAWVWEHQALVRARFIAGSNEIKNDFEAIRFNVLSIKRDATVLKNEVNDMRLKMRKALSTSSQDGTLNEDAVDFKHDAGGMVDLEFLVQHWVLGHAHQSPDILKWTDNIRTLESLAQAGVISNSVKESLLVAYQVLRKAAHRKILNDSKWDVPTDFASKLFDARQQVRKIWTAVFDR